jgi:hypothetical protein
MNLDRVSQSKVVSGAEHGVVDGDWLTENAVIVYGKNLVLWTMLYSLAQDLTPGIR